MTAVTDALVGLDQTSEWQEELYKHLHEHPELPFQEVETCAEITRRLDSYGFQTQQIGGGVVGVLVNGEGPTVLFRADIDALPVQENTGLPYSSNVVAVDAAGASVPVMHACGHDAHVTCALGAAQLLSKNNQTWAGTYVALFQPAEELGSGAQSMVDDGLVDKVPRPDVCMGQHVLAYPEAGKVGTIAGPMLSAGDCVKVTVYGKGSHGSMPHLGVDPAVLASSIVMRLQTIVAREIKPSDFGVVTVGSMQIGTKANIITDRAVLLINLRAYDMDVRATIKAALERIVKAECEAAGSPQPPDFDYYESYPLTSNDADETAKVTEAFKAHFGEDRVVTLDPMPASEDFSNLPAAWGVPYTYWGNGAFLPGMTVLPNHNPGFAPAIQPTLKTGTEAIVAATLAYLRKE